MAWVEKIKIRGNANIPSETRGYIGIGGGEKKQDWGYSIANANQEKVWFKDCYIESKISEERKKWRRQRQCDAKL